MQSEEFSVVSKEKTGDNKFKVTFSNGCSEIFSETEVLEHYLYEGSVLFNVNYGQLIKKIKVKRGISAVMPFVTFSLKTEKQTEDKLSKLGYDQEVIDEVIEYLRKSGYLNDHDYARKYVNTCLKTKIISRRMCEYELIGKGISEKIASDAVELIDDRGQAKKLAEKKKKQYPDILKLKKFLYSKGFTQDTINSVLGGDDY